MNHLLSRAVAVFIERTDEAQSLRVLEIGGGTGATTSCVLPLFPADRTEYIFTDISPLFVARMKTQSADVPFLSTRVLDIEKDPLSQGLVPHSFDVVIAAQVLHATQDLQQTLNHVRALLSPKGLLLLLEPTTACLSTELVTGLLDGWWRFTDFHLRPSCPFLSASEWQALLSESGFGQTATISPTETPQASVQAAVVLAQLEPEDAPPTKQWIVFSDSGGIGQQLVARLKRRGDRCVVVSSANVYRKLGDGRYELNGRSADDFSALFAEIGLDSGDDPLGVAYLWNLDTCASPQFMDGGLPEASRDACVVALHLIQSLARLKRRTPAGVWLVTRGAIPASTNMNSAGLAASTLWGLGKVAVLEHPELHCVLVDLDPDERESSVSSLLNELGSGASREQVLIRGEKRFVARLARSAPPIEQASTAPIYTTGGYSLAIETRGTPDNLRFVPLARPMPRAQQVQVKVNATGLNFADVMDALGLLPFERPSFGVEFSGEISQLGENVQGFVVGDQVFGAAPASFDSHVTVHTSKVRKIPANLDFNDAATITVAFATAYYALHEVAKMTRGDRVLIHAAGGGVGLAAIQLAQLVGAEVFATAHPDKWERLKHYGAQHVMNSRTTAFAEEVLSITNGQGVDIVLNSLTGDMIPKSLAVLRQGGRFIEIGKRDIWSAARVAGVNAGVQYAVVDLLAMIASEDQSALAPVLDSLLALFNDGRLKPLPRTVFSLGHVVPAFRYMQQAKHFGKVVLDHRNTAEAVVVSDERPVSFREDATYLIIGGTGGLGLVAAEWLSTRGARHIVLMGRREPSAEVIAKIQRIETLGAKIVILRGDVSSHDDVSVVLQHISNSMPPLRGILHSALALDDAVLLNQNAERFEHAFAPKVNGSWLLHTQTSGLELDFFMLFSAGASLLGNQGQANYAAANAFLDSLAHYRRQRGLAGMSINWGPWARVGVAATRGLDGRRRMIGVDSIEPAKGMAILDRLYAWNPVQVGVLPIRWPEVAEHFVEWPLVSHFRNESSGPAGDPEFLRKLDGLSVDEKRSLIAQHIKMQMAGVLGLKDPNIPLQSGFFDLGMDSLTAVELRNKLQASFGCTLPPTLAFDYPTVGGLIDFVSREVLSESEAAVEPEAEEPIDHDLSALLGHVEQLTDLDALGSLRNNRMRAI
jgi:NADPH:quinone reductase-like Zn-dependent oxidoreductase/acyl carrier protein/SAM-dependent methyltransferase